MEGSGSRHPVGSSLQGRYRLQPGAEGAGRSFEGRRPVTDLWNDSGSLPLKMQPQHNSQRTLRTRLERHRVWNWASRHTQVGAGGDQRKAWGHMLLGTEGLPRPALKIVLTTSRVPRSIPHPCLCQAACIISPDGWVVWVLLGSIHRF